VGRGSKAQSSRRHIFSHHFVLSAREAAWPSRGWDTAIRLSTYLPLKLDRFLPLANNTLQFKPKWRRDT
jgi:hypothetical protein